jgi:hypothetical protein
MSLTNKFLFLLLASVVCIGMTHAQANCTNEAITSCIKKFFTIAANVSQLDEARLNVACSELEAVDKCLKDQDCSNNVTEVKFEWAGVDSGFKYFCGHRKEFLEYITCWDQTLGLDLKECVNHSAPAVDSSINASAMFCKRLEVKMKCIKHVAIADCKAESATFFTTFIYKMSEPFVSDCVIDKDLVSGTSVTSLSSFSLLITISTALFLVFSTSSTNLV